MHDSIVYASNMSEAVRVKFDVVPGRVPGCSAGCCVDKGKEGKGRIDENVRIYSRGSSGGCS